jgi:hypothetical protein
MVTSGIGVQAILPRTGTGWRSANPVPDENNDAASKKAAPRPDRVPASQDVGHILDKLV